MSAPSSGKLWNYPLKTGRLDENGQLVMVDVVPEWCQMPPSEHLDALGGCWGISYGEVEKKGKAHCEKCEYNRDNPANQGQPS